MARTKGGWTVEMKRRAEEVIGGVRTGAGEEEEWEGLVCDCEWFISVQNGTCV